MLRLLRSIVVGAVVGGLVVRGLVQNLNRGKADRDEIRADFILGGVLGGATGMVYGLLNRRRSGR